MLRKTADSYKIGNLGENAVCEYIQQRGLEILKRNYRVRGGEIDIIAKDGEFLAFIEVKTRKTLNAALESVTQAKKGFLIRTAQSFLADNEFDLQPRFDVACVIINNGIVRQIDYYKNAFI